MYSFKFRNNVKLTFIKEGYFSLYKSIFENVNGISIIYEGNPVKFGLMLLNCQFLNSGNIDLEHKNIHRPLTMSIPIKYSFLKCKITNNPPKINIDYVLKDRNTIEFKWDLLKSKEYFSFDILIDMNIDNNNSEITEDNINNHIEKLIKSISFERRITNLSEIKMIEYKENNNRFEKKDSLFFILWIIICIIYQVIIYPFLVKSGNKTLQDMTSISFLIICIFSLLYGFKLFINNK